MVSLGRLRGLVLIGSSVFCLPACASNVSQTGGETNWLCEADTDCAGNLRCVERRCSVPQGAVTSSGSGGANGDGGASAMPSEAGGAAPRSTGGTSAGGNDDAGGVPRGPVIACNTDYARYQGDAGRMVSLRSDVMPVFGLSCTVSDCHNSHDKKSGLDLGWRCAYDAVKRACIFPAVEDPNTPSTNPPKPLTEEVVNAVYASLLADSATASGVKQVVPGDPSRSFLLDKLAGTQNERGYTCTNQDPSREVNPVPCGDTMPQGADPTCEGSPASFELIVRWITQGARNN
jgi:hypothetical protein